MKTTIQINGKPVDIMLTPEQVAQVMASAPKYLPFKSIISVEKAFESLNMELDCLPDVSNLRPKDQEYILNHYSSLIVTEAINEGWEPNWNDPSELKFSLWPDIVEDEGKPSGFGFSYYVWADAFAAARVGSRLCFQTEEKLEHYFKYFQPLCESWMLIPKP